MPGCNERNTFSYEYRHDGDNELVNRTLVKERRNDLTSTHQPDVLACVLRRSAKELMGSVTNSIPACADFGFGAA